MKPMTEEEKQLYPLVHAATWLLTDYQEAKNNLQTMVRRKDYKRQKLHLSVGRMSQQQKVDLLQAIKDPRP